MTAAEQYGDAIRTYAAELYEEKRALMLLARLIAAELRRAALLGIEPRSCDDLLIETGTLSGATVTQVTAHLVREMEGLN